MSLIKGRGKTIADKNLIHLKLFYSISVCEVILTMNGNKK